MGVILVRGIAFLGRHGLYPEERRDGRRFEVDVDAELDPRPAAASDRLEDTIDYTRICELVLEIGEQRRFRLIERLAEEIARQILSLGRISAVTVEVRKFVPELPGSPRFVAIRIRREQPS